MYIKYPRTYHLQSSPGTSSDDRFLEFGVEESWENSEVVITEKMDGENSTGYSDYFHARSLIYSPHKSRNQMAKFHDIIKHQIPENWRICGENMTAVHSIRYENLPSIFLVFSIWENNICFSWDDTKNICSSLGLSTVPELFRGLGTKENIQKIIDNLDIDKQEGIVIRPKDSFEFNDFSKVVGKWVRKKHVKTDQHWLKKPVEYNGINYGVTHK
jgi:ATP-dependent RNA circularization protein (DNA/RNA ligase family)